MSVLGTIWLKDMPLIDRYGDQADNVNVRIHAATTMGYHLHLNIAYYIKDLHLTGPELEAQLSTDDALELGNKLITWATREKERITQDEARNG